MFDLPWYGWLFGIVFWTLVAVRARRGGAPGAGQAGEGEDGPQWSPMRRGGGF